MKRLLIIVVSVLMLAAITAADVPTVRTFVESRQPKKNAALGVVIKYTLAPARACTTDSWQVGGLGGFSLQYADSQRQGTNKDTAILYIRFQVANRDTGAAFNATGMDSVVCAADTNISHTTFRWSRIIDYTTAVKRAMFMRLIVLNNGPDSCHGLKLFPMYNEDK